LTKRLSPKHSGETPIVRKIHLLWLALAFSFYSMALTFAAPLPVPIRTEVLELLKGLQVSGCQFYRNGTWYTGAEAQSHLMKKLEYLEKKEMVKTAEDFIKLGASTSSLSGNPYLVRCADGQSVESKRWLQDKLKMIRESK
jgi:Family of unknown function (DUF5329)